MARKLVHLGSSGPFPYDDTRLFPDGTTPHGIVTDGIIRTSNPPSDPDDVLRQADIGAGVAPHDADYLTLTLNPNLSNERVFTIGNGLDAVDGGANGNYTVSVDESELDHGLISGLLDDDHSQYALLAGRAGSQTLIGGSAADDDLGLQATSHGTPSGAAVAISSSGDLANEPFVIVNEAEIVLSGGSVIEAITINSTETVVNEGQVDRDFRVESNNNTNMLIVDAGNDRIGINHGSPGAFIEASRNNANTGWQNGLLLSQGGTGDLNLSFLIVGTQFYTMGIDNSDGDKFKIAAAGELDSSTIMTLTSGGLVGIGEDAPAFLLDIFGTNPVVQINRVTGESGEVRFSTSGTRRWSVGIGAQAESGSNAGSDFEIKRADDAGALLDVVLQIHRDTGLLHHRQSLQVDGSITGSIDAGQIDSGTFADARIAESNVTQHEGAIDHDALTNFVANEHIDWTGASNNLLTSGQLETTYNSTGGALKLNAGEQWSGGNNTQIAFGYNGSDDYPQFIRTRHNAAAGDGNAIEFYTSDGTQNGTFASNSIFGLGVENLSLLLAASRNTDTAPNDDTSRKRLSLQKLASPPSNGAYLAFSNNPGTDTFYLVLEEG